MPRPDFKAEKLTAYELGYRDSPLPDLSLSASLYFNVYADLRTEHYTPVDIYPLQLRNGIQGDTYGGEAWAKYAVNGWWRLSLGASWLQRALYLKPGRNDLTAGQSIGQDPPYQAQLRSEMNPFDDWEFDAGLRAVGHVTTHDSTTGTQTALVGSYVEADLRVRLQDIRQDGSFAQRFQPAACAPSGGQRPGGLPAAICAALRVCKSAPKLLICKPSASARSGSAGR